MIKTEQKQYVSQRRFEFLYATHRKTKKNRTVLNNLNTFIIYTFHFFRCALSITLLNQKRNMHILDL